MRLGLFREECCFKMIKYDNEIYMNNIISFEKQKNRVFDLY